MNIDASLEMMSLGQKGYYCSQIILTLGLEAQGKTLGKFGEAHYIAGEWNVTVASGR